MTQTGIPLRGGPADGEVFNLGNKPPRVLFIPARPEPRTDQWAKPGAPYPTSAMPEPLQYILCQRLTPDGVAAAYLFEGNHRYA